MKSYYYFYTSLKDLNWDIEKKPYEVKDLIERTREALTQDDFEMVKLFLYRYDNRNLVNIIEKKNEFNDLGFFSQNILEEEIKVPTLLPSYMIEFLENLKSDRKEYAGYGLFDQLSIYYYKYVMNKSDDFLKLFTFFDFNLKNLLVSLNCRKYKLDLSQKVLPINEEADAFINSSSNDFGLSLQFSWLNDVIRMFEENDPLEFQEKLDQLVYDRVNAMVTFEYFTSHAVLGYLIKYILIERHLSLDMKEGAKIFENNVNQMVKRVNL